jgi:hypothetical protein
MGAIRLFCGFDAREAAGWHVFAQSVIDTGSNCELRWLTGEQRDGSNAFTYERFSIPERCSWSGWAVFTDAADMLLRAPLDELYALRDPRYAIQVVKHDYLTGHPRKYVGTEMESDNRDYPRKNWSSVMLINCAHIAHFHARDLIRQAMLEGNGKYLHRLSWLTDNLIGELPLEWNWLADEYGFNGQAKLLHWTAGIPGFLQYRDAPHADEWRASLGRCMRGMQTHTLQDASQTVFSER